MASVAGCGGQENGAASRISSTPPVPLGLRSAPMLRFVLRTATIAGAIAVAACVEDPPISPTANTAGVPTAGSPTLQVMAAPADAKSYVIDFTGTQLPADLAAQVSAAGGTVTTSIDQIGVAVAASSDPGFAARAGKIKGVSTVTEDIQVQWVPQDRVVEAGEVTDAGSFDATAAFGASETFRRAQWVPDAISAPAAWDAGATGAGVRVAILDGGIRSTHIDIAPELDVARSRSFVPDPSNPGTFRPFNTDSALRRSKLPQIVCDSADTFWHGTHVAGIVAAPGGPGNSNLGTVGIAPNATIIGVKVLHCGSGAFSWILNGIIYAATPI